MKQSNNKKSRDVTAFLYERLSRDDNLEGESYSIGNQKKLLAKVAKEKGYTNLVHFLDDGISGVTMDRPGFVEMICQLEQGKAAAVFVKDLSRLGRNYIEVGRLTEEFFPNHDIRLVAVSDNIDTAEGENELAPIRNLFNEWYARDISKKRRISNKIKGNAGEPMGQPPYGYIKDPNDPKHWIVDDEAAQVVRRVYSMTLEGFGTEQIAAQLEKDDVLTPRAYWLTKGIKRPGKGKQQPPTKWNSSTITKILSLQEYCGDILNFKTYSKSYKNKKRIDNDRENWVVFQDVHEAIIERAVYEQVQQKRGKIRKRRTNNGEHNMFSGLLVCADCGSNLHFHFNQGNPEIKYFNCSNYKGNRGTCTSTHYVRVDFLEEVVLGEIRRLTKFASLYEDEFVKAVIGHSQQAEQTDRKLKEKELRTLLARDEELDGLFERIYEDNVSGKLSDDRFAKMSRRYEDEQKELAEKIKKLRSEIEKQSSRSMTTDMFIGLVRKYTRARKLTPRMLNELIEKIEVFNAEKIDGVWEQRLRIHYNCVGTIEIPTVLPLPIPEVSVNTRKGVVVNYAPCELAV
jgi:DNA invertase Pin-like site-specific DNA recombinase